MDSRARSLPDRSVLVVVGSGSLARAVCCGLAVVVEQPVDVVVAARAASKAAEVCYLAGTRAALSGRPLAFRPAVADCARADEVAELLASTAPAGVLLCASTQSPWERPRAPSAWTALLDRAGFGLTLPLHAELALVVGRAVAEAAPGAWFVNACFPDAVNPLLAAVGARVLCGIGNVALMAASLQAALGLEDQRRLEVLAHHVHLHAPGRPDEEALAWCDDAPVEAVSKLLAAQRATARPELNRVTGYAGAVVLRDLLAGAEADTSLPGPVGLPGGYPVRLRGGRLALRLPPGVSETEAVAFNQRAALRDGAVVEGDRVRFGPVVQEALEPLAPDLAGGFRVADAAAAAGAVHRLRDRLRAHGGSGGSSSEAVAPRWEGTSRSGSNREERQR